MLQFTDLAKQKVQEFIRGTGKPEMALRIRVTGKNEKGLTYGFALEEFMAERPDDQYVREGGFATRLDPSSFSSLKSATVDWVVQGDTAGFSVKNPNNPVETEHSSELKQNIINALRTVFDPEIPVNIYDLGLIYDILIDSNSAVVVKMTLTAPNCPAAEALPAEVKEKVKSVASVTESTVDLTWEPAWDKSMMSEEARLQLGM